MYYLSDGNVDVSTPGALTLFPGFRQDTIALTGTYNRCALQTDGGQWWIGAKTSGGNFIQGTGGAPFFSTIANDHEIMDLLYVPYALIAITDEGLWAQDNNHLVVDSIPNPELPVKSLAYLDGLVYYLKTDIAGNTAQIKAFDVTTDSTSVFYTTNSSEKWIQAICSSASGIFFATTSSLPFQTFFYTWSGNQGDAPQRVAEVYGRVEYCFEALGTVYVLCRQFQHPGYTTNPAWTLYSVVGNQVSVIDDARQLNDPNFAPTCQSVNSFFPDNPQVDFSPMLWTDGRFLYIAWPGLSTRRLDLVQGGISSIGPNTSNGATNVSARRFITAAAGISFVDVSAFNNEIVITQFGAQSTSGSLVQSFIDLDAPGMGKIMRAVQFQTSEPLAGAQAVEFAFRLDQNSSFTPLVTQQVGPRSFIAPFPTLTKNTEVQMQVTLTADPTAGPPTVTSMTVIMDVGRVETYTLSCRRVQQSRAQDQQSVDAQKYSGKDLWANLENIRNIGGGYGYAFIPDPTQDNGVSEIQIQILDIQKQTPTGAATGQRTVDGETDMERDVAISFIEFFPPQ